MLDQVSLSRSLQYIDNHVNIVKWEITQTFIYIERSRENAQF